LLGKLVFELEHAVAFEDEDRFGPLKILDYLHDKVFKMLGLYTLVAGDSNNPGARSVPLLKLVISKGPMPLQVCDYHKQ
jgi:hypothetical protein